MSDLTVLYYTSNHEDEKFEEKIRENILKQKGDLPLISVSQKPIPNFGQNICVGEHENCYGNEFRQIQIGLKEVKTKYVISAESDVLYPPEYFQFQPTTENHYRYGNVWMHYARAQETPDDPQVAFFKLYSDGAQIMKTDFWLDLINRNIGTEDNWFTKADTLSRFTQETIPENTWTSESPVITFKTLNNVSRKTCYKRGVPPQFSLPYWGDLNELKKKIFLYSLV
jgi:hypothetical protein